MWNSKGKPWRFWGLVAALGLTGCLFGGGSETNDGAEVETRVIHGMVESAAGAPIAGAVVKLFPSGYDPTTGTWITPVVLTDSAGRFAFVASASSGLFSGPAAFSAPYSVVARSPDATTFSFVDSVRVGPQPVSLRLAVPRSFEFAFQTSDSAMGIRLPGVAFVPGTDLFVALDGTGREAIDSVPLHVTAVALRFGQDEFVVRIPSLVPDPGGEPAEPDTVRIGSTPNGPGIVP